MGFSWRESRLSELVALKVTDPAKLIAMYRQIAHLGVDRQLPRKVSFMGMIDAILDDEATQQLATGQCHTAGKR